MSRAGVRVDVTAEQLHSLSGETRRLIRELPADRPVFIQAYISPEVPEPFVQARANLLSVLDEIDALAGSRVEVLVHDTESFTDAARDARETFGIRPRPFRDVRSTRADVTEVFMGLAFTCGAEEQVVPFFDRGLPTEYEVVRSIRVVAGAERKRIGVVRTMMDLMGGVDYQQNRFNPSWPVVEELRKQYEVYPVDPEAPIEGQLDALLVPLPSSLQTDEMANVADFIRRGTPAMLLVDPMPAVNPQLSPTEWVGDGNPFAYPPGSARPGPRGNVRQWMADLGVSWEPTRIVWDGYNPHPELAHMPDDVVFLGRGNGNEETFNEADDVTAGLQELVFLWPGYVEPLEDADAEFQPLLRSGMLSGTNGYFSIVRSSPFGPQINPEPPREQDEQDYVVAARIRSPAPPPASADDGEPDETADGDETEDAAGESGESGAVDLIVVADLDFIGEQFFAIREQAIAGLNFDNVTFFLNAIDTLVGDDSFINLRNRRARHRTLERVEAQTARFNEQLTQEEQQAEEDADQAIEDAQARLDVRVEALRSRADIDAQTMQIMVRNLEGVENRRLEVLSANIEAEKETRIQASRENMESQIRQIQTSIQTFAVLLPPVPVFVLGVVILLRRRRREREGAAAAASFEGRIMSDMSELKKTLSIAGIAVLLGAVAMVSAPRRAAPDAFFDVGEPFFPEFTDPEAAATLEVIEFDEEQAAVMPFKVTNRNGLWTIPSHHDYPADGEERLANAAADVISVIKDDFRSDNVADHEALGVVDPTDDTVSSLQGRGSRVTFKAADEEVLADLVVGRPVPGRPGLRFVRAPGQKRVYAARFEADISTAFEDWIETNLLEVERDQVDQITLNEYFIDERTLSVVRRGDFVLGREGPDTWSGNNVPAGQEVDTVQVNLLVGAVMTMKIAGVRPKPPGLSGNLREAFEQGQIGQSDVQTLTSRGFYPTAEGGLLSNEGELLVRTNEGVLYTLRFGEIVYGSGDAVAVGDDSSDDEETGSGANRYVFITAEFDESGPARTGRVGRRCARLVGGQGSRGSREGRAAGRPLRQLVLRHRLRQLRPDPQAQRRVPQGRGGGGSGLAWPAFFLLLAL